MTTIGETEDVLFSESRCFDAFGSVQPTGWSKLPGAEGTRYIGDVAQFHEAAYVGNSG